MLSTLWETIIKGLAFAVMTAAPTEGGDPPEPEGDAEGGDPPEPEGDAEGEGDAEPEPDPDDPKRKGYVDTETHQRVVRESVNRKQRIRELEEENLRLRGGKDGDEDRLGTLEKTVRSLKEQNETLELRDTVKDLTDGATAPDGTRKPRRVSPKVVDILVDEIRDRGIEEGKRGEYVADFVKANPGLFVSDEKLPEDPSALEAHGDFKRASEPTTMDPKENLVAWREISSDEKKKLEERHPGITKKMQRLNRRAIAEGMRQKRGFE